MQRIESLNNQQVKNWKKLQKRRERVKQQAYVIEGFHLVEEAFEHQKKAVQKLILREDLLEAEWTQKIRQKINSENVVVVTKQIADHISGTETSQGVFAELSLPEPTSPAAAEITGPFLLLDAVQDPGNVGTMIRTADAAGFQGVFLGQGSVDLYNDKTLRSAQGSHFHLDILDGNLAEFIPHFKKKNYPIYGTALNQTAKSYKEMTPSTPFALIVGNEGAGISAEIMQLVDHNIYIPMKGQAESLNVAIAASILMFHLNN